MSENPKFGVRRGRGSRGFGAEAAFEVVEMEDGKAVEECNQVICTVWYNKLGWSVSKGNTSEKSVSKGNTSLPVSKHREQAEAVRECLEAMYAKEIR